jgi:hypothetical protein
LSLTWRSAFDKFEVVMDMRFFLSLLKGDVSQSTSRPDKCIPEVHVLYINYLHSFSSVAYVRWLGKDTIFFIRECMDLFFITRALDLYLERLTYNSSARLSNSSARLISRALDLYLERSTYISSARLITRALEI